MTAGMGVIRARVLQSLADALVQRFRHEMMLVGVDGVDGSGKTVFADELAVTLRPRVPVERVSIDGFHKQRADRYRLGRTSPEGFWLDSYDYDAFECGVVQPLRAGALEYLEASHDLATDEVLDGPLRRLDSPAIVIVDGIFLHRPELRDVWDFSLYLDVDFSVSVARMSVRDGSSPDPEDPGNRRYVEGQKLYFEECAPWALASLVVDNNDLAHPRIVEGRV